MSTSIWPVNSVIATRIYAYIDIKDIITAVFNIKENEIFKIEDKNCDDSYKKRHTEHRMDRNSNYNTNYKRKDLQHDYDEEKFEQNRNVHANCNYDRYKLRIKI